MDQQQNSSETWQGCEPGTISRLGQTLRSRRRGEELKRRTMLVTSCTFLLLVGVITAIYNGSEPEIVRFVCRDVDRVASQFIDGSLDDRSTEAVEAHLSHCKRCEEMLAKMRGESGENPDRTRSSRQNSEPQLTLAGL